MASHSKPETKKAAVKPDSGAKAKKPRKGWVASEVSAHPVLMFSKSDCPHCTAAKKAIAKYTRELKVHELDLLKQDNQVKHQDALERLTGTRTVPRVFIGGIFVGGGDDMVRMSGSGELEAKLGAAGVPLAAPRKVKNPKKVSPKKPKRAKDGAP